MLPLFQAVHGLPAVAHIHPNNNGDHQDHGAHHRDLIVPLFVRLVYIRITSQPLQPPHPPQPHAVCHHVQPVPFVPFHPFHQLDSMIPVADITIILAYMNKCQPPHPPPHIS